MTTDNIMGLITVYELGELDGEDTMTLFSELIRTGLVWRLQGSYGRTAAEFIRGGLISPQGEVDWDRFTEIVEEY